jgi:hypothetical protein
MGQVVRTQARAVRVFLAFVGSLFLVALLISANVQWLDAVYVALIFGALFVFSVRTVFAKWRSDDSKDVTKQGPGAAYPDSWKRWLTDDYPDEHR